MKYNDRDLYVEERGKYREPSKEELDTALACEARRTEIEETIKTLNKELDQLRKNSSRVFYDVPGFPYDVRYFIASGTTSTI